jgi:hypothetical protein
MDQARVWTPESHLLFPQSVRRVVQAALMLQARPGALAALPGDVLLDLLGYLPREQVMPHKSRRAVSMLPALIEPWLKRWKAAVSKARRWRGTTLFRQVPMVTP